jgi:hypothetical protein
MKKVTKRDVVMFILGIFTFFTIAVIYDWENNVQAFMDGIDGVDCGPCDKK